MLIPELAQVFLNFLKFLEKNLNCTGRRSAGESVSLSLSSSWFLVMEQKVHTGTGLWPRTNVLTIRLYPKKLLCSLNIKVLAALSHLLKFVDHREFKAQDSCTPITLAVFSLSFRMFFRQFLKIPEPFLYLLQTFWKSSDDWLASAFEYLVFQFLVTF